jgi:class 3 adenylate cyclase
VHLAARIGAVAGDGEILVSAERLDEGKRSALSEPRSEKLKDFDKWGWRAAPFPSRERSL